MKNKSNQVKLSIAATATMLGTIIGVGIFALPSIYSQAPGLSLVLLGISALILILKDFLYLDLIFEPGIGVHQLPGIVKKLFGKKVQTFITLLVTFSRTGYMFLYTLIVGNFATLVLENIFDIKISRILLSITITFISSLAIRKKIKFLAKIQLYLSIIMVAIVGVISWFIVLRNGLPDLSYLGQLKTGNLSTWQILSAIGIIQGISMGALTGTTAIPSLKQLVNNEKRLRFVTAIATVIAGVVYTGFVLFVLSNSTNVSQDALSGLDPMWAANLFAAAGILCIITSYLSLGNSMYEIFHIDHKISGNISWLLTFLPATLLVLTGFENFSRTAAVSGSIIGGIEGLVILVCYWKEEKLLKELTPLLKIGIVALGIILSAGIILSL